MTTTLTTRPAALPQSLAPPGAPQRLVHRPIAWWRARRIVQRIGSLDDHLLNDIGILRDQIDWIAGQMARG